MNNPSMNKHPMWGLLMGVVVGALAGYFWIATLWPSAAMQRAGDRVIGPAQGFAILLTVWAGYLIVKGAIGLRRLSKATSDREAQP